MDDAYRKQQDLIFQQIEDLRRLGEAAEQKAQEQEALNREAKAAGLPPDVMELIIRTLNKIEAMSKPKS